MPKSEKPRIQFTLRDLLLVMGLTGFALFSARIACVAYAKSSASIWFVARCLYRHFAADNLRRQGGWRFLEPQRSADARLLHIRLGFHILGGWRAWRRRLLPPQPSCNIARWKFPGAECCKAFAEAEEIYHRTDYSNTGVLQYAKSLGMLYGHKGELSLIDKAFAYAELGRPFATPKVGFFFKVLTAQGPNATGGRQVAHVGWERIHDIRLRADCLAPHGTYRMKVTPP